MRQEQEEMFAGRRVASGSGVEQARQALTDVYLPVDFPLARSKTEIGLTLNAIRLGRVVCGFMRFRDAVRIDTAAPENYHVNIPTSGSGTMRTVLGSPVYGTPQTGAVFSPGRPVELDYGERYSQLALMIPHDPLHAELESLLDERAGARLEFDTALDLAGAGGRSILHALRMIDAAAAQDGGRLTHPLAAQRLEQVLVHSLLFSQPHNYTELLARPPSAPGAGPVRQAVELLRGDPGHPWTVAELATAVSVSVRSLQEGFRHSLDTTPTAYLRRLRLEKVHQELSTAEPGTVGVTEVATRWGFVHLGRFAAAYTREYGERPSATLRR